MRAVTGQRGRWVWVLAGLVTAAALVVPGTRLIDSAGVPWHPQPTATVTHAVPTPLSRAGEPTQSYGAPVQETAAPQP
jgi:hypothetical protein